MVNRVLKSRSQHGFTLIELLVVVIIIGILAAIALPNFIGAQDKAREASVKANMRTAQISAESFATDNGGQYPTTYNDAGYLSYFPGGLSDGKTAAPSGPVNPFSNVASFPAAGPAVSVVATTRASDPSSISVGVAGTVGYTPLVSTGSTTGTTSYAILGASKAGTALGGSAPKTTLVLSNQ